MESEGTSDFHFTSSSHCNPFMVDVSCSGRPISPVKPLNLMEDLERTDENDNLSSSAGMGNALSHCSSGSPAAQLEDEFKQFLVERGTYKELKKTISSVLHELLQAKRTDGSPLFVFYIKEVSSTDNSFPRSTSDNTSLSHNHTNASVPPSPKSVDKSAKKILKPARTKSDECNQRTESKCQGNCDRLKHKGTMDALTPMDWPDQVVFHKEKGSIFRLPIIQNVGLAVMSLCVYLCFV